MLQFTALLAAELFELKCTQYVELYHNWKTTDLHSMTLGVSEILYMQMPSTVVPMVRNTKLNRNCSLD